MEYPNLEWQAAISERKNISTRCPYATVHRCPRYFYSMSLLANMGRITPIQGDATIRKRWEQHELSPVSDEGHVSCSMGNCFSNMCPEVSYEFFGIFANQVIEYSDEIDRDNRFRQLDSEGAANNDWRWFWDSVSPMHYSDCSIYSKLYVERSMTQISFNGAVSGQINVAGNSIQAPAMNVSVGEILARIDASTASEAEKTEAKSKLGELLSHPLVASIVGGLASGIIGPK